jgi:hypothetical protein
MKTANHIYIVLITALVMAVLTPITTNAQDVKAQEGTLPTTLTSRVSNEKSQVMSFDEVKAITESSIRAAVGTQLAGVTADEVNKKLGPTLEKFEKGEAIGFSMSVSGYAAHSITEQHMMNVKVSYEARPIGGILTVRVELVPVFSGIGSASRPIAVRELSQAVDYLDEDMLGPIVSELSHELGSEYAGK